MTSSESHHARRVRSRSSGAAEAKPGSQLSRSPANPSRASALGLPPMMSTITSGTWRSVADGKPSCPGTKVSQIASRLARAPSLSCIATLSFSPRTAKATVGPTIRTLEGRVGWFFCGRRSRLRLGDSVEDREDGDADQCGGYDDGREDAPPPPRAAPGLLDQRIDAVLDVPAVDRIAPAGRTRRTGDGHCYPSDQDGWVPESSSRSTGSPACGGRGGAVTVMNALRRQSTTRATRVP